jgi:GAF domain-containing protein/anti-sigma regulatory factor (Ser/Thr protein kinase)
VVTDIASDERWKYKAEAAAAGLKSAMVAPLQVKKMVVGVLDVYTREIRDFTEFEKTLVESFAPQVAITQRLVQDLVALNKVSLLINSKLRLSELFRHIVQSAARVLDCQHVSIFLADKDGSLALETTSAKGIVRTRFAPGEGLAGWVVKEKQSALVVDAVHDRRFVPGLFSDIAERSMLVVPIITVEREIVGIISADRDGLNAFDGHDQSLLETLASQAAVAVRNARLFEQEATRAAALQRLHEIGRQLLSVELSVRGLERVLRQVARSAQSVLGADLVDVYQYVEAERRYTLPPILEGERQAPQVVKEEIFEDDVIVNIVAGGEPLYTPDALTDRLLSGSFFIERPQRPDQRFVVREEVLSSVAIPLKAAGETVGVMFINYRTRQDFTPDQREIIELFANQAAMAIHNARVFEQIQARIKALAALNEVGRRLSTVEVTRRGLSSVLRQVAQQAKKVLRADLVELYRYSPEREDRVAAHVFAGQRLVDIKPSKRVLPDDVAAQVLHLSKPLFTADAQHELLLSAPFKTDRKGMPDQRFIVREQIVSTAAIPLRVGDEAVGILFVNYRTPQKFPVEQRELIQLFAGQAAVAIRNAQLFQQRDTLQDIARDITSELDRDKLLQRTLERSLKLLHCEFGSISVFDPATNDLQFQYAAGKSPNRNIKLGEGLIGTAAEKREPVRVADVSHDTRYICHVKDTRSELDVPMLVGDRLIGVLNAESRRLNAFSKADQHLAEALAAQTAVAFRTAELYEGTRTRLQERVDDITALQDIYALIGTASLEKILEQIAEEAARLTPAKYTGIWLLDEQARELRFGARNKEEAPTQIITSLPLNEVSINAHVALTREAYLCNDVRRDPYYREWYEDVRSELTTPLVYGEKAIGTLDLESTYIGAFTDDHVRLVEVLAGAAAVAIQSARTYGAIRTLNTLGQVLTRGIRLRENEVLELIHSQASELMNVDNMYIALYDEATDIVQFGLAFVDGKRADVKTDKLWQPRKAGKGRTEEIIRTKKPILHATKAEAEAWYAQPERQDYWSGSGIVYPSWLGVPMTVGEKVLGVIATYHPTWSYLYSRDNLEILQTIANEAAIALDNAHMFYDVNRRLEALVKFGQMVTSGIRLGEAEILELIYGQARQLMDTGNMYIALYDETTDFVRFGLVVVDGERIDVEKGERYQPRRAGRGRTEKIIRTRKHLFHATKAEAEAWYAEPGHEEYVGATYASWLGVPMIIGEKVLGVIATYHPTRDYVYSGDDLKILQAMANQAAIALDNARLYEEARSEAIATKQLATLGTAIAALQHRINNTFNIIVPNVTRLRKRVDVTDATIVEILEIIERNARYTSDIIARIQEPLREVDVQDVNVNAVLDEVVSRVRELQQADPALPLVSFRLNLDDSIPQIRASIGQITEVFRNLVDNACHAMKTGGRLTVASCLTDGTINVRVQDTGPGIPPQIQQRLFSKPVPSKDPGGGAGLGLWLSQLMLRSLGGDVKIETTGPTGTAMLVQIPTG